MNPLQEGGSLRHSEAAGAGEQWRRRLIGQRHSAPLRPAHEAGPLGQGRRGRCGGHGGRRASPADCPVGRSGRDIDPGPGGERLQPLDGAVPGRPGDLRARGPAGKLG